MGAAAAVAMAGAVLLAVLAARWVPRVDFAPVRAADIDSDIDADFSVAEQARERSFRRRVRPWGLLSVGLGVLVPTLLVLTGVFSTASEPSGRPWWTDVVLVVSIVLVVTRVITLPPAVVVRRASLGIGLAAGTWWRWSRDLLVGFALSWGLTVVAMLAWVGAARTWPDSWWVVLAVSGAVTVVLLSFLVPVVIEPLFARFAPMTDSHLRTDLLALAAADGVPVSDVLVADASRRSTALNAYVSGLGPTRRIVVHDTLLARGRDDEVRAVVAHELGHVVAHDVRTATILGSLGAAATVAAAAVALGQPVLLDLCGVAGPADPAVASVLIAAAAWLGLLTAPVQNAVSRRMERRADQHCLELTRDPATVAAMHRALAVVNVAPLRPPLLLHLWFGTHPTSPERVAAARAWAADHGVDVPGPLAATG